MADVILDRSEVCDAKDFLCLPEEVCDTFFF